MEEPHGTTIYVILAILFYLFGSCYNINPVKALRGQARPAHPSQRHRLCGKPNNEPPNLEDIPWYTTPFWFIIIIYIACLENA